MTDLTLTRSAAAALLDRLDTAAMRERHVAQPNLGFASAAIAVRDALHAPSGREVNRPRHEVTIALTEDEVNAVVRAALTYGSGRPVV